MCTEAGQKHNNVKFRDPQKVSMEVSINSPWKRLSINSRSALLIGTCISVRNHDSCVQNSESSGQKTFSSFFQNKRKNFEETEISET